MSKPTIRILQPGDEAILEAFLQPRLASSMFLIGNMRTAGLEDHGQRFEGSYAAAFDRDEKLGYYLAVSVSDCFRSRLRL